MQTDLTDNEIRLIGYIRLNKEPEWIMKELNIFPNEWRKLVASLTKKLKQK